MLRIWGRRTSFNVQKVMWLVGELGLEHQRIPAGGDFGGLADPAFLAMNPHGRIPVIDDDGVVVWESHAILRFLTARHGRGRFWSGDPAVRSRTDEWMEWSQTALQTAFLDGVFWSSYRTPELQRDASAIAAAIARCAEHMRMLDRQLARSPYLSGEDLGLADIPAGAILFRYFELDIERPEVPNVEAWYERLKARDAYRTHVMVPFGELFGRLDNCGT